MIYEQIARDIIRAHKTKEKPNPDDISGVELFSHWTEESFDRKISLARKTRNSRKARALEIIKAFCIADLVEA